MRPSTVEGRNSRSPAAARIWAAVTAPARDRWTARRSDPRALAGSAASLSAAPGTPAALAMDAAIRLVQSVRAIERDATYSLGEHQGRRFSPRSEPGAREGLGEPRRARGPVTGRCGVAHAPAQEPRGSVAGNDLLPASPSA